MQPLTLKIDQEMNFEVYCDESGLEALNDAKQPQFFTIGGIWMPKEFRPIFKERINQIKQAHGVNGEVKWNKVSPRYIKLYQDLIAYFFETSQLRFRVIVVDAKTVNSDYFHGNKELGFYKFYYQLLHHWIYDFNNYYIFLDQKVNRDKGRLKDLQQYLDLSNLFSDIPIVQALPSTDSPGIQLADVLTGMVRSKFNNSITSESKKELILEAEETFLGNPIRHTPKSEEKFNVFKINLQGGW